MQQIVAQDKGEAALAWLISYSAIFDDL